MVDFTLPPLERLTYSPPPKPPPDPYDALTPEQKAEVDRRTALSSAQLDLADQPRSATGEVVTALKRGALVELPRMIGQAFEATGKPGDLLYGMGRGLVTGAAEREPAYAKDITEGAHGAIVNALVGGAEMLAPSVAPLAALPVLGAAGVPAAAAAGIAGVAGGALFGASQYQETYEKAKQAGLSESEAKAAALKTGAIEALGETAGTWIGGKFVTGAVPRILGKKYTVDAALTELRNPKFLPTLAKDFAKTAVTETGTEMGQNYGEAAVEQTAGIDKTDPWTAATAAIGPTLAMSVFLGPLGAYSLRSTQNKMRAALNTVEAKTDATVKDTDAALRTLQPAMEPLVGKEQYNLFRIDRMRNAKWFDEAWSRVGAEEAWGQGEAAQLKAQHDALRADLEGEIGTQAQTAEDAIVAAFTKTPEIPTVPVDTLFGRETRGPQYRTQAEAEAVWAGIPHTPAELEAPAGTMSFAEFVAHNRAEREKNPVQAKMLGKMTQQGLRDAYAAYLVDQGRVAETPKEDAPRLTPAEEAQDQLDLDHPNLPPQPRAAPTLAQAANSPATAMSMAMERAGIRLGSFGELPRDERASHAAQVRTQEEARQRAADLARAGEAEAPKVGAPVTKPARGPAEAARVAAGEKLAEEGVTGNTPVAAADLRMALPIAAKNAGVNLRAQEANRIGNLVAHTEGLGLWVNQLAALERIRDGIGKNTVSRDALSALIDHLKNRTPTLPVEPAAQEKQDGKAKPVREITGTSFQDPLAPEGKGEGAAKAGLPVQEAKVEPPTTTAPAGKAAPAAGKTAPAGKAGKKEKAGATARALVVTSTGKEDKHSGEGPRVTEDGTITYDTPHFKPTGQAGPRPPPRSQFELRRRGRAAENRLTRNPNTSVDLRRERPEYWPEKEEKEEGIADWLFSFETNEYDPTRTRGYADNAQWVNDVREAFNLSRGRNKEGVAVKWTAAELPEATRDKANAQEALDWLKRTYPEDYAAALDGYDPAKPGEGNSRLAQQDRIRETDAQLHDVAEETLNRTYELYKEAYQMRVAAQRGIKPENVVIDKATERKLREMAARDPGLEYAQTELPNYTYSDSLMQSILKGNLDRVLMHLEQNGPSEWVQQMAHQLRLFGLKTKIALVNQVAYDPRGNRVYGKYQHLTDTVRIYLGGENPHTVLHEVTHGASVGNIAFAKAAEKKASRNAVEEAAVTRLNELREIMDAVGFTAEDKERREEEFVAEVFSNERMQQQLRTMAFDERSLWQRFKDWVRGVFGGPMPELSTALEAAISRSIPFLGESRFGAEAGMEFNHSATAAMGLTDNTLSALNAKYDEMSSKVRIGLPVAWRKAWMKMSTTFHLNEMVGRVPALRPLLPGGMNLYTKADETGIQIRTQVNSEIEQVLKPLNAFLAKLSNREAIDGKMMELAGGASRLGIDLTKNFDQNKASFNKNLDPSMRQRVNELHAMFMQQPAIVQQTMQRAVLYNRKHYMQHAANLIRISTSAYADKQPALVATVNKLLDIMDSSLHEGTNPNPAFFADTYTANLSHRIDKALKHIRDTEKGQDSALAMETELLESIYRKSVASPYAHLGRSGNYFLEYTVAAGDSAWQQMQQALEGSGKVIDHPTESRKVFMRFETVEEMSKASNAINMLGPSVIVPDTTRNGSLADTSALAELHKGTAHALYKIAHDLSARFTGPGMKEIRDALMAEIYSHMGDDSPRQALRQRKESGIPGYDATFRANFVKRGAGASSLVSNSYTMPMYRQAFDTMQKVVNDLRGGPQGGATAASGEVQVAAQEVLNSFQERFRNRMQRVDTPWIDRFKALGYNWFLGMSPAFMLTNLMQPYHLTLPLLGARYGFVRSAKEMGRSAKKAVALVAQAAREGYAEGKQLGGVFGALEGITNLSVHGNVSLSQGEQQMLVALTQSGQLDLGLARELTSLSSNDSHTQQVIMRLLATGSHYTEVVNRLTAALAAYNLDMAQGGSQAQHEHAVGAAIHAVRNTQFNYSDYNTAPAFGRHGLAGKVTPLLTSFQNFSFQVTEMLFRLAYDSVARVPEGATAEQAAQIKAEAKIARKALAGVMATTSMLAGTLGLPMASVVARLYDALAEAFGDDDKPSDIKTAYRAWLSEVVGKDVAEAIARGIPRAVLGWDMSNRSGLADVVPGTRFFTDRRALKDQMEAGAFDMMGPAVSAAQEFGTGLGMMHDGNVMDGLLHMTPLAIRGPLKAGKLLDKGYTTASGIPLPMEVTPWAVTVQAAGFTPSVMAEHSEVNFAFQQREAIMRRRKTALANQVYRAMEEGRDPTSAMTEAMAFSQANPEHAIDLAAGMQARAKMRATAALTDATIATSPRYLPSLSDYSFAVTK